MRKSAKTRSWEKAEQRAREMEAAADPSTRDQAKPRRTSVREAVEMFLNDEEARGLEASSRKKSKTLFERQFQPWCEARKLTHLDRLTPIDLTEFRASWGNGQVTTHRKHERMVSFFSFCVRNELLRKNPMEALKKPKTPDIVPTDYFRPEEFDAILKATEKYEFGGGTDCRHRALRLRALTLLMRWSGLSILDATKLERDRLRPTKTAMTRSFCTGQRPVCRFTL